MPSLQQLCQIFAPLLAQHSDLVLRGRWLFRPPIGTAIIGLYIGRTSSSNGADMALSVVPLSRFLHPEACGYDQGFEVEHVIGVPPPCRWDPDEREGPPRIYQDMFAPNYQAHLARNFDAKVPQFLDAVRTHDDVVAWVQRALDEEWFGVGHYTAAGWLAAMRGEFSEAADCLGTLLELMPVPRHLVAIELRREEVTLLKVLQTGDRATIAAHLHGMEERTIASYKLQRFWRRTPFPFE